MTTSDPLGDMLRRARHMHAPPLTQDEVAEAMDAVQSTVSAWESGRVRPSLGALNKLARVLDIDVTSLIDAAEAAAVAN